MMSSEPYKNEYQTSIMASRIVKDLVKQKLPKGETFDPVHAPKSTSIQKDCLSICGIALGFSCTDR